MSINSVVLVGRLTKDIEVRMTQSGAKIGNFILAVQRNRTGNGGQVEADFIRCMVFNKTADNMQTYTHKGSQVAIEGHIQTGSYTDRNGQKIYTTDVVCDTVQFLDPKENNTNYANNYQNPPQQQYNNNQQMNYGYQNQQNPPQFDPMQAQSNPYVGNYGSSSDLDIDSDDLPF